MHVFFPRIPSILQLVRYQFLPSLSFSGLKPEWNGQNMTAPIWAAPGPHNRQTIYLDDEDDDLDFVTLHNILYYVYTGYVNLYNNAHGSKTLAMPVGSPDKPDPFRPFRNADKFVLPVLMDRC